MNASLQAFGRELGALNINKTEQGYKNKNTFIIISLVFPLNLLFNVGRRVKVLRKKGN